MISIDSMDELQCLNDIHPSINEKEEKSGYFFLAIPSRLPIL